MKGFPKLSQNLVAILEKITVTDASGHQGVHDRCNIYCMLVILL